MSGAADPLAGREIILEWSEYGEMARVAAIDAATGIEATAVGPLRAARADLERLALGKLARRLFPAAQASESPEERPGQAAQKGKGRLA